MKRRLHQQQQDSLELLLDTLCNVFGGIILIACLLAMLSRPKTTGNNEATKDPIDHESGILIEKRIEQSQSELDGFLKLRAQLQSDEDPATLPLITELTTLKKTAAKLRQDKAKQSERASAMAQHAVQDVSQEIARLREQEQEIERKLGLANKAAEAARQMKSAIEKNLADLQLELEDVNTLKIEKLRFPRERVLNKKAAPVILQYGQIFPLFDSSGNANDAVRQVPAANGIFTAFAKPGRGMNPTLQRAKLLALIRQLVGQSSYLTLYIYPDSYGTLRELKKIIHELGADYGMELCTEHQILIFDPKGVKPAPL